MLFLNQSTVLASFTVFHLVNGLIFVMALKRNGKEKKKYLIAQFLQKSKKYTPQKYLKMNFKGNNI
jgi:hypothetical protein